MGRTFRVTRGLAAAAGGVLMVAGLAGPVSAQDPVTFRIGITQAPSATGLNPYLATESSDYYLISDMYDQLIELSPSLEPAPGLATSWDIQDGGKTWVYHIRQGVTWQDGTPFTAEDVRFQLQYIFDSHDPAYKGPQAPDGNDLTNTDGSGGPDGEADHPLTLFDSYLDLDAGFANTRIKSIEAPDDATLIIRTSEPMATLANFQFPILPKHIWEGITFADASLNALTPAQAIGTGPFQIESFDPEQVVVLNANKGYWGGTPHVDQLVYQVFGNGEAKVNALINGDVDFLDDFPATLVDTLRNAQGVTVNTAKSGDFKELGFNSWDPTPDRFATEGCADCPKGPTTGSLGNPWLTKPEVRAALAGLIDKKAVIAQAAAGFGEPGVSIVSPLNPTYSYQPPAGDPVTFPDYTDDASQVAATDAARQRFQAVMTGLGFADTDGNGILNVPSDAASTAFDPNGAGKDWTLRLYARDSHTDETLAGDLIATWMQAAGVNAQFTPVSEDLLYQVTYPSTSNADYDMYIWRYGPDPDPQFILSIFACNQINGWSDSNYCDPAYDEMYRQEGAATSIEQRAQIVKQLQDKAYHDAPYAVLWYEDTLEAYRSDRFEGFNAVPSGGGSLWSTYGLGPWGSRLSVGPIGAAGGTPPALPAVGASAAP